MDARESKRTRWGGRLWLLAVIAVVLTVLLLAVLAPRPLAYISPAPTAAPWTAAPGLYTIPTAVPPTPTAVPPAPTSKP
jgi:hypothetical protein